MIDGPGFDYDSRVKELHQKYKGKIMYTINLLGEGVWYYFDDHVWHFCSHGYDHDLGPIHKMIKRYDPDLEIPYILPAYFDMMGYRMKFDENLYILPFKNGVYDLKEKRLRPGHPSDFMMKKIDHDYRSCSRKHLFDEYLYQLFNGDQNEIDKFWSLVKSSYFHHERSIVVHFYFDETINTPFLMEKHSHHLKEFEKYVEKSYLSNVKVEFVLDDAKSDQNVKFGPIDDPLYFECYGHHVDHTKIDAFANPFIGYLIKKLMTDN